jgi:hypothetical protein
MPNVALVLVAAAVLEACEKPSTYKLEASWPPRPDDRRPGRITIATDDMMVTVPPPLAW